MAGGAGGLGRNGVGRVAIQAAQSLMYPGRCAIIRRTELAEGVGGVTLRAEPLVRIGREFDGKFTVVNRGDRQLIGGERRLFASDVQMSGLNPGSRCVDLMTGQAWNDRLVGLR